MEQWQGNQDKTKETRDKRPLDKEGGLPKKTNSEGMKESFLDYKKHFDW